MRTVLLLVGILMCVTLVLFVVNSSEMQRDVTVTQVAPSGDGVGVAGAGAVEDMSRSTDSTSVSHESHGAPIEAVEQTPDHSHPHYITNDDFDGQLHDAILTNRNPDCRAYVTGPNDGNFGSSGMVDASNNDMVSVSEAIIDLVIASNWNQAKYDYDTVIETDDPDAATHCRIVSNMIPNHDFGVEVNRRDPEGVWVNPIDHTDVAVTYIPINPEKGTVAYDTPRNPPTYDLDGILLNGVGIAMDSGFCYKPGVTTGPRALQSNAAGNASGCGPQNVWFELPAYTIYDEDAEHMAATFDQYFGHGFVATYHYHAITHPLQEDTEQIMAPESGSSPVIGFAPDGFPIYGRWFYDAAGELVQAQSGYEIVAGPSRVPNPVALHGTPPTPWDIANRPDDFASDFGLSLGRYEDDWYFAGTGNLDECNGAYDMHGDYGYYVTDKYPFAPPCTFGQRDPSFGKPEPAL